MKQEVVRPLALSQAKVPKRVQGKLNQHQALKEEIMKFAGITHPNFSRQKDAEFLRGISEFTHTASLGALKKYKKQIQRGNMGEEYPLEVILSKENGGARKLASFLGPAYFEGAVLLLGGPNNIRQRATAERMLKWALEYGDRKLQQRALAGLAMGAAREMEVEQKSYLGRENATKRGIMGFLCSELGSESAKKIISEINRVRGMAKRLSVGIGLLCGTCAGAVAVNLGGGLDSASRAIAATGIAVIGVIVLQLIRVSRWGLGRRLISALEKESENGQI